MRLSDNQIILSAGDLSHHIACKHLTTLDQAGALGTLDIPPISNPSLRMQQELGLELERNFLEKFRNQGLSISEPSEEDIDSSIHRTTEAMKSRVDLIYQASLKKDTWVGRADFLKKVNAPSDLGSWSYEVFDSKLARHTRTSTILQLCLYSELVASLQGKMPEYMHVLTTGDTDNQLSYRVDDFYAYYRYLRGRLICAIAAYSGPESTYPTPCAFCSICNWWERCNTQWRKDDHLSFVAGLGSVHLSELTRRQINTLEILSDLPIPIPFAPERGAVETYLRLREQARVQATARKLDKPFFELVDLDEGRGLFKLPLPSPGDIFFDFEGDPYAHTSGLEYLFGWIESDDHNKYQRLWALNQAEERKAFEIFVDKVMSRWRMYPEMHIYHFTAYEPSAMKRLMGKYATKEKEVDEMLRASLFIDLHTIVRQAILAGVETYSLKELEKFHQFERGMDLKEASAQLRIVQRHIERKSDKPLDNETVISVEKYNQEDCQSTLQLRNWLEQLRSELENSGNSIPRPPSQESTPSEELTERQLRIEAMAHELTQNLSPDPAQRDAKQQAKWLLANMLDWYRREEKATWWEFFRLRDLSAEEMMEEKAGIGGLKFTGVRAQEKKSIVDEYEFPPQDHDIKEGDDICITIEGSKIGIVTLMDTNNRSIKIKKRSDSLNIHPDTIFKFTNVPTKVKEQAIEKIARWVMDNDIDANGPYQAGRDLLMNLPPRTSGPIVKTIEPQDKSIFWINRLSHGVLPIQGPPGAGKSHTAAQMILALLKKGKKVGITALSHKVIVGLIQKVMKEASSSGIHVSCMRKVSEISAHPETGIIEETQNETIALSLLAGTVNLVGGTAWLWAREDMANSVDVLFVDEAGQLSLIDTIAVSPAAQSLVLLGDPQQLQQPQQGSHPEGTEVSALQHILGREKTIPEGKGLFLETTWRMHPSICNFVSELFYENRLTSKPDLANQRLDGWAEFGGSGLFFVPIRHEGNQNSSKLEAALVSKLITKLTSGNIWYTDKNMLKRPLIQEDIKVITPYNAQVNLLSSMLPRKVQVGTVDKFQGQEAPVIIFSMATSSPADAPRGMEFLYSSNRFNVAVSRARSTFILVASPLLFDPDCKSVDQMRLANAFSRFLEVAEQRTLPEFPSL